MIDCDLKTTLSNLELIETITPNYTLARYRGVSDEDVDTLIYKALNDITEYIEQRITENKQ